MTSIFFWAIFLTLLPILRMCGCCCILKSYPKAGGKEIRLDKVVMLSYTTLTVALRLGKGEIYMGHSQIYLGIHPVRDNALTNPDLAINRALWTNSNYMVASVDNLNPDADGAYTVRITTGQEALIQQVEHAFRIHGFLVWRRNSTA